eukprot:TRINITY_DN36947_c0_g1_i1.p1 TRINITY_DN36947_c0_g1~~TRINITY_DN36947_c0_g1_i1.p1  ORF type:complete len:574 (+),score=151.83 TRINITY_DN36947_c0_g1_i1:40-1761(+)
MDNFWRLSFGEPEKLAELQSHLHEKAEEREIQRETPPKSTSLLEGWGSWSSPAQGWNNFQGPLHMVDARSALGNAPEEEAGDSLVLEAGPAGLEAFRSLARRSHQLLARQQRRAEASRRAAACESGHAAERLSLAIAEAEEMEEHLKQYAPQAESGGRISSMRGWFLGERASDFNAASHADEFGANLASTMPLPTTVKLVELSGPLMQRWESEDEEAQQEQESIFAATAQAAAELRSGLLRLPLALKTSHPDATKSASVSTVAAALAAALPSLAQSCADAMDGGSNAAEDAWAGGEASLLEALVQLTPSAMSSSSDSSLLSAQGGPGEELAWLMVSGEEEARDQASLNKLLQRLEMLSRHFEESGAPGAPQPQWSLSNNLLQAPTACSRPDNAAGDLQSSEAAISARLANNGSLEHLELQVQRLVEENQALENSLRSIEEEKKVQESAESEGAGDRLHNSPGLSGSMLAERSDASNRLSWQTLSRQPSPSASEDESIGEAPQLGKELLAELRSELADVYELLAQRNLQTQAVRSSAPTSVAPAIMEGSVTRLPSAAMPLMHWQPQLYPLPSQN